MRTPNPTLPLQSRQAHKQSSEYNYDNSPLNIGSNTPAKRPRAPLSYEELLARKKSEEENRILLERAQEEYSAQRRTSFSNPELPASKYSSPFRPHPGSRRHLQQLYNQAKAVIDNKSYPFPEDLRIRDPGKGKKEILFKKAHRFLVSRHQIAQDKMSEIRDSYPKKMHEWGRRTAYKYLQKATMEKDEVAYRVEEISKWKEGEDETFALRVTTADIQENTPEKVKFLKFSESKVSIRTAAKVLQADSVVAFPTETVYGLGANALSTPAVQKIYKAKNRPADNPLITHFGSLKHLESFSPIPEIYLPLVETFWPGPLTILIPVTPEMGISPLVTAGLDTVAVRVPSSPLARALILESKLPIAAPSANASTRPSPTMAVHVYNDLNKRIPLILTADEDFESQCDVGLESTVVDGLSSPPTVLRLGGVSLEDIRALGGPWRDTVIYKKPGSNETNGDTHFEEFKPRTPGMKYRHYSPRCPVYVYAYGCHQPERPSDLLPTREDGKERKIAVLCTKDWEPKEEENVDLQYNWLGDNNEEVARNLFKCVRAMDEWGAEAILVEGVEEKGIGRSVMERLKKMAGGSIEKDNHLL